jgi:hypothetical protein
MADLVITSANVAAAAGATVETGTAGVQVNAGQAVYKDPADNKYRLAQANSATPAAQVYYGIALNNAAPGQPLSVLTLGDLNVGATLAVGQVYVLSGANPGGIAPVSDLVTGWNVTVIGVATSTNNLRTRPCLSGTLHP